MRGWDRRNAYYFSMIASLAKHYKFDVDMPWQLLPAKIRDIVLHGSGDEVINLVYVGENGNKYQRKHTFEGILPNLERRYRETESAAVREELTKYISERPCTECHGARLNRAARNVFVADRPLPEIATLPIDASLAFFDKLTLPGWRGEIAVKIVKEIRERLGFLVDVGLDYLTLERKADSLSGGEAQRIKLARELLSPATVRTMFVLDEPSTGLHAEDVSRLMKILRALIAEGHSVVVIEHQLEMIAEADWVLDLGPEAGAAGGRLVASGTPASLMSQPESRTGAVLREWLAKHGQGLPADVRSPFRRE